MEGLEMDFFHRGGAFLALTALIWCIAAGATNHEYATSIEEHYDLRRLMKPSPAERASEERGRVHIYDSLEINEINAALDENFDRIQNMMFIRINHLPATGSGPAEVEDDGCD